MEAILSTETSIYFWQTLQFNFPEGSNFHKNEHVTAVLAGRTKALT